MCKSVCVYKLLCVKASVCKKSLCAKTSVCEKLCVCVKKLYERYDANYCLVFVIYCLDTTLLVCLLYIFNILSCNIVFPY